MKALSVQQPFAGLLVLGIKKCETRSWDTKHRGELAIHASAKMSKEGKESIDALMQTHPDIFFFGSEAYNYCTQLGSILGTVKVWETFSTNEAAPAGSWEKVFGDYSKDRFFWCCNNPVKFISPIPYKGALSLWNWTPAIDTIHA